ncbi:MAG: cation:proton antiporter [Candidatus Woesearchaeota archaeon]
MLGTEGGSALGILTAIVIIIIIGLIITGISRKFKISNILLLILTGLILGSIFSNYTLFNISTEAILTIAVLTLVLVVFDGASRFKLKSLDTLSFSALKLSGIFLTLNLIFITTITIFLFFDLTLASLFYSLVFAAIISGTDPASVFIMLHNKSNKVLEFLKIEGIINTPLIVLLPFILLDILNQLLSQSAISLEAHLSAILTQILVGIGAGIVVGLIFFKGMKKFSEQTSGLSLICSALLAFILAENLGGNGVLAVAVLGFMFGAFYISKKEILQEFNEMLSNSLEILVFIIIGFIIQININLTFILYSLLVFLTLIITRFLSTLMLPNEKYNIKEKIYMTLTMPKGIAVAVLIVALSLLENPQIDIINNLLLAIIIYSLLLATIVNKFSEKLINIKV